MSDPYASLPLPEGVRADGTPLTFGIRPEHITIGDGPNSQIFRVGVVEQLGAQTLCVGDVGGCPIRVMMDRTDTVSSGTEMTVSFPPHRIHIFAAETGERLGDHTASEEAEPPRTTKRALETSEEETR